MLLLSMDKNKFQSDFVKLFNDVKEVFFSSEEKTVETKKQEFATEGMLADGSKVVIDGAEPAIGMPVMAVTAEGQAAPIPDGEYTVDFAGKKYNGVEVDIWSSGIILFAMICGYCKIYIYGY